MSGPRILVVDDEPDVEALITQSYRRQMRRGEIDFLFAGDGEQAIEVLRENPDVDVVLSRSALLSQDSPYGLPALTVPPLRVPIKHTLVFVGKPGFLAAPERY